jgi:hypothetical protein
MDWLAVLSSWLLLLIVSIVGPIAIGAENNSFGNPQGAE